MYITHANTVHMSHQGLPGTSVGAHAHFGDAFLYTVQPELYSNGKPHVDEVMIRFPDNMFQRFLKEM